MPRYYGHFEGDAQQYRERDEVKSSRAMSDPIKKFLQDPRSEDLSKNEIENLDNEISELIETGLEKAYSATSHLMSSCTQMFT